MGPRKRAKPNPAEISTASLQATMPSQPSTASQVSSTESANSTTSPGSQVPSQQADQPADSCSSTPKPSQQARKTRSWYGSWPRTPKSTASTQVARETILGGTLRPKASADLSRFDTKRSSDPASLHGASPSLTSLPNISENGKDAETGHHEESDSAQADGSENQNSGEAPEPAVAGGDATERETEQQAPPETEPEQPTTSSGWLGWIWSQPGSGQPHPAGQESDSAAPANEVAKVEAVAEPAAEPAAETIPETEVAEPAAPQTSPEEQQPSLRGSSWFGLWSVRGTSTQPASTAEPVESAQNAKEPEDVVMEEAPPVQQPQFHAPTPKAGSTWAFWSRDPDPKSAKTAVTQLEEGQLAVMGESSEAHPRRSSSMEVKVAPPKEPPLKGGAKEDESKPATPVAKERSSKSKRVRPQSMDIDADSISRPSTPKSDATSIPEPPSSSKAAPAKTPTPVKTAEPNLLLPSFRSTYQLKENPSILKQLRQLILRSQHPPENHVYISGEPRKIKRALAIGIHGLFPANYLRPMIGQPTGTSIKFANHCAEAIRRWADSHGCESCEIEKVALEGEGRIGERVENLWKLLLNWIDHIRRADLIVLACHSQGVPVTIMLLAKLIELSIVTNARIGVCAMAGVSLGPFPDYRSGMGILMGSAAELWEFSKPDSEISQKLEASVKAVLNYGARITYVASIDDQLVPMESALYSPANHPYIYRAVFIDRRIHAPDFIANFVGFALKLRNLGVSDHGLIRELSLPLAGSLYSGEGHSRLYDDGQVYDLAVSHALETTDVSGATCHVQRMGGLGGQQNPYHLPWVVRGLLEEDFVRTELGEETARLLAQFDEWKPVTKALKDVKYRLEAVRSKL